MQLLEHCIGKRWWKCRYLEEMKQKLICKNVFVLTWGAFWPLWKMIQLKTERLETHLLNNVKNIPWSKNPLKTISNPHTKMHVARTTVSLLLVCNPYWLNFQKTCYGLRWNPYWRHTWDVKIGINHHVMITRREKTIHVSVLSPRVSVSFTSWERYHRAIGYVLSWP